MQPLASELSREERQQVAKYYAGLMPPSAPKPAADAASVERGRLLARIGNPSAKIPACEGCHTASSLDVYPRLSGQHAPYMVNRLQNWRNVAGLRSRWRCDHGVDCPVAEPAADRGCIGLFRIDRCAHPLGVARRCARCPRFEPWNYNRIGPN